MSKAVIALTASLTLAGLAFASPQTTHDHQGTAAGSAAERLRSGDLAELLKESDVSVRALQGAVREGATKPAADSASELVLLADSVAAYFDVDPPRPVKDAKRAQKALARQAERLTEVAQTAPPDLQPAIDAAIDANRSASDVVEATTEATASASGAHHQGPSRGCGHH